MNVTHELLPANHGEGRRSIHPVDLIVIHVIEGSMEACRSWFRNAKAQVSAHYAISCAGEIVQFVAEDDTAWHAGRVQLPTSEIVKERIPANPNGYSIGIEHEGDGTADLTDAQRAASVALIRDICQRRGIPIDRHHIVGHHEIYEPKRCPGKIDVDRLVREAAAA